MNPPKDVLVKESYLSTKEIATRFKHNLKDIGNQYNPQKKGRSSSPYGPSSFSSSRLSEFEVPSKWNIQSGCSMGQFYFADT
jgi:hypothetical protein